MRDRPRSTGCWNQWEAWPERCCKDVTRHRTGDTAPSTSFGSGSHLANGPSHSWGGSDVFQNLKPLPPVLGGHSVRRHDGNHWNERIYIEFHPSTCHRRNGGRRGRPRSDGCRGWIRGCAPDGDPTLAVSLRRGRSRRRSLGYRAPRVGPAVPSDRLIGRSPGRHSPGRFHRRERVIQGMRTGAGRRSHRSWGTPRRSGRSPQGPARSRWIPPTPTRHRRVQPPNLSEISRFLFRRR